MQLTKSSNPVFKESIFDKVKTGTYVGVMTISGTVNKIALLLLFLVASASYTWGLFFDAAAPSEFDTSVWAWVVGGGIGGLVLALATVFKPVWSPYTAPVYALCEGFLLGGLSAAMESYYPGIVVQAVGLTFATLFAMLFAYRTGLIKVTQKFKAGVMAATGGIFLFYLLNWILGMFNTDLGLMHDTSMLGIGISLFVVVVAALNLVLDFDFIEKGTQSGLPKYMEWYGAFGLMVTIVWLYIELLRLLSKLASRD